MKAKIYDATGTVTAKSVTLSDDIFGIEPNNHAIYLDVKQHLANKRQGTHKSKERAPPVPFCFFIFLVDPAISARSLDL